MKVDKHDENLIAGDLHLANPKLLYEVSGKDERLLNDPKSGIDHPLKFIWAAVVTSFYIIGPMITWRLQIERVQHLWMNQRHFCLTLFGVI